MDLNGMSNGILVNDYAGIMDFDGLQWMILV